MTSEREGRTVFYGAMVTEGVIALIWAAAGVSFYNGVGPLSEAISSMGAGNVVYEISTTMMGPVGGVLAMLGVIACPITSGDTAFRSARLTIADWFKIDQSGWKNRLFLSVPVLLAGAVLTQWGDFNTLWRYFSWSNQTLAMMVLWAGAVYLHRNGFPPAACFIAALPGDLHDRRLGHLLLPGARVPASAGLGCLSGRPCFGASAARHLCLAGMDRQSEKGPQKSLNSAAQTAAFRAAVFCRKRFPLF